MKQRRGRSANPCRPPLPDGKNQANLESVNSQEETRKELLHEKAQHEKYETDDCLESVRQKRWNKAMRLDAVAVGLRRGIRCVFGPTSQAGDQTLPGHVPPVTASLKPIGRLNPTNQIYLAIGLRLPDQQALLSFLEQLYDPKNPNFRHYLTPKQFTESFGPSPQDYQAVLDLATGNSFVVTNLNPNRMLLDVTAAVADVEKAFHVTMLVYQHPTEPRTFYAPSVEPSLDPSIPVLHISGLNDFARPRALTGPGPGGGYAGGDFRAAYVPNVSLKGSGEFVGLVEFGDYYHPPCKAYDDVQDYEDKFSLPHVLIYRVPVDGGRGYCDANRPDEVALDVDMTVCMAPRLAGIILYQPPGDPTSANIQDMLFTMAQPVTLTNPVSGNVFSILPRQFSSSWLLYDTDPNADNFYLEFAAQGQSFFQASGDDDAFCWNPQYNQRWADSPYITIVGGTTLTTSGPEGAWQAETTWNSGGGLGSGGGISINYAIPTYQQGLNMTANHGSTTMRNVPDVAMVAAQIYIRVANRDSDNVTGTSAAAPLWAGFTALVNQQAATQGKAPVGFLNPTLYNIYTVGDGPSYGSCFHDVATGDNSNSCAGFAAVSGYDLCTGLGTPTGNLINALVNPGCNLAPWGVVAWWPGEGNTLDNTTHNNGIAEGGLNYGAGEVGQAFSFNGVNADIRVPGSSTLDVGAGNGFTVEAWINPSDVASSHPIVEWRDSANNWTVYFNLGSGGLLSGGMIDPDDGSTRYVTSTSNWSTRIVPNVWQHVAFTYDKTSGLATLYLNGVQFGQANLGIFRPTTTGSVFIGQGNWGSLFWFQGLMDEVTIYSRALAPSEILLIYSAKASGKCCLNCG